MHSTFSFDQETGEQVGICTVIASCKMVLVNSVLQKTRMKQGGVEHVLALAANSGQI